MNKGIKEVKKIYLNKDDPEFLGDELVKSYNKDEGKASVETCLLAKKYMYSLNMDNLSLLSKAVDEEYKSYIVQIVRDLENELKVVKPSEKIIIHNIAVSYVRILQLTTSFNSFLNNPDLLFGRDRYCSMIGRELDRAHKHYEDNMKLLIQLRARPINVKIGTLNNLFGTNQQLNVVQKDKIIPENQ